MSLKVRQLEKVTSKGTKKSMPTDGEDVKSEGRLRDCMCLSLCVYMCGKKLGTTVIQAGRRACLRYWGGVCSGEISSVHVYMLLRARKSVPAAGVGLWGVENSVSRCQ